MANRQPLRSVEDLHAELEGLIRDLPDNYMACRDFRHSWDVVNDFHVTERRRGKPFEITRNLACLRCGTERHETYNHTRNGLEKVKQAYVYAEGYQMRGVGAGVKPYALIQEERYRRVMARIATLEAERAHA